jgi:CMP-N-acetylneuraminic acid synthetase
MITPYKIVCIIPARGKSKRLPGKNIVNFLGKPLIAHSILAAKRSSYIEEVFVTTDDDDIAEVSRSYGAKVIKRPEEFSSDFATTAAAIKHALQSEEVSRINPSAVLTLQPTNPLRPENLIDECIEAFINTEIEIDSLISVSINRNKIGKIQNNIFEPITYKLGERSQDMVPTYYENGLVYITKTGLVLENEDLFGKNIKPIIVEGPFVDIDIDTKDDLEWAEFIGKKHSSKL